MLTIQAIARALGGVVTSGGVLCPGPGHSPKDRSLSVTLTAAAPDGFICHSHAGDDWRACRDHVLTALGREPFAARPRSQEPRTTRTRPADDQNIAGTRRAQELWQSAADPRCTIVEKYLNSRSLELGDDIAGNVVRYHPACPWREDDGRLAWRPAMLAAFRSITTDELVAVHRTLLTDDGTKIGRRMLGPVAGAAIKIDSDESVSTGLHICEGFETGLAGRMLSLRPCWALGSAGAIAGFPVLDGIEALTILAETDGANARAVKACGERWFAAGREVLIARPIDQGDMNDALRRCA